MHYCMARMHYLSHGVGAIEGPMFGLRPRASDKRTKNQTVRLSEGELAEVQRMAQQLSEKSGYRYTVGDVIREGLRCLRGSLESRPKRD